MKQPAAAETATLVASPPVRSHVPDAANPYGAVHIPGMVSSGGMVSSSGASNVYWTTGSNATSYMPVSAILTKNA